MIKHLDAIETSVPIMVHYHYPMLSLVGDSGPLLQIAWKGAMNNSSLSPNEILWANQNSEVDVL